MTLLSNLSFDQVAIAALACLAMREALIALMPNHAAGPGGWLLNSQQD
jgi:hypothetical protein